MKLLKVGPRSAGSTPGPVCYGRGGGDICVTDADLALGLLDAGNFLGGDMKLDLESTQTRLSQLADDIGVSLPAAAAGIYRIVSETMASAARAHAVDRGVDYRGTPLLAFGGAGPLHGCYVAELLGSTTVIVPPHASVLSAFGMLVTPVRYDLVRGALAKLNAIDWATMDQAFGDMIATGRRALMEAGVEADDIHFTFGGDFRYFGQANEITVAFAGDPRHRHDSAWVRAAFERAYEAQYGLLLQDNEVEIVSWRLTCRGPDIGRKAAIRTAEHPGEPSGERRVHLGAQDKQSLRYAVYERRALATGQRIAGPALVEERETTTVVLPDWWARIDATGCIIIKRRTTQDDAGDGANIRRLR